MEVNEKLKNTLEGITENAWEMICPEEKPPEEYLVYNSEVDTPEDFGDNEAQEWIHHVQVHIYTEGNYKGMKKAVRDALKRAGFTINEITRMYDRESGYFHVCFACSIQEDKED